MAKVKIIGAGSIGNHYAQACRRHGWEVTVVDVSQESLSRMKDDIYPTRYGQWDASITLATSDNQPMGGFDIIIIGTPPDSHIPLAIAHLDEDPKILHIEKPLSGPSMEGLEVLQQKVIDRGNKTCVTVGYDHVLAESIQQIVEKLKNQVIGEIQTFDVEFREHWAGIFNAHPWLAGPHDSYLGFTHRGGGAGCEHSHALNLWQYIAHELGWGSVKDVRAMLDRVTENGCDYDAICSLSLRTDNGRMGRVVQDVVTKPTRKWLRLQGDNGFIEWQCNGSPEGDLIRVKSGDGNVEEMVVPKKRPDDFYQVVKHYDALLNGDVSCTDSPLALARGVETMKVIASAQE